jgi:hypothetical protein
LQPRLFVSTHQSGTVIDIAIAAGRQQQRQPQQYATKNALHAPPLSCSTTLITGKFLFTILSIILTQECLEKIPCIPVKYSFVFEVTAA